MRHVREKLISPLIVLCLADLMLDTNISHMFTLQPFHHNHCLCLRIPFPSFHGCLSFQPFYSLSRSPVLMGCSIPICDDEDRRSVDWEFETCPLNDLDKWRSKFQNTNIYRSLEIRTNKHYGKRIVGPFLVDIDNTDENIDDALAVTRKAFH